MLRVLRHRAVVTVIDGLPEIDLFEIWLPHIQLVGGADENLSIYGRFWGVWRVSMAWNRATGFDSLRVYRWLGTRTRSFERIEFRQFRDQDPGDCLSDAGHGSEEILVLDPDGRSA